MVEAGELGEENLYLLLSKILQQLAGVFWGAGGGRLG